MNLMTPPRSRSEFEHRLNLLREEIRRGRMHFAPGVDASGLAEIRFLPNGRIDLLSINELARLQANTTYYMKNERLKKLFEEPTDPKGDTTPPTDAHI